MARSLKDIQWHDPAHAATAFLTVIIMPLTYSIAYGLLAGIGCWIFLQSVFRLLEFVGIERPVFLPEETNGIDATTKAGGEPASSDDGDLDKDAAVKAEPVNLDVMPGDGEEEA